MLDVALVAPSSLVAEISEQAQVSNWPLRIFLCFLTLAVIAMIFALIARSWNRRAASQTDLGLLPAVPQQVADELENGELETVEMRYVGTASEVNWNDKIAYAGLSNRGFAEVAVHDQGVVIDRNVGGVLFVPREAIVSIGLAKGVAGRAYGKDGVVAIRWTQAGQTLDTGLRSSSAEVRDKLVARVERIVAASTESVAGSIAGGDSEKVAAKKVEE